MGTVILRSQQATKNLQLLENSNADPSLLLRMTAWMGFSAACLTGSVLPLGSFGAHFGPKMSLHSRRIAANVRLLCRHFVMPSFVFIHIAGSTCIFNIF